MLRGFDYGLLAMLAMALVYGIAWSVLALTLGLIAIGLGGGWLIGAAVREGVARRARAEADSTAAQRAVGESAVPPSTRGMSTLGAVLGAGAWVVGSYVAFAIVQVVEGSGALLDTAKLADFMGATLQVEPTWLQPAVLAAFVVVGWMSARPRLPRAAVKRGK